jgi:hypothetical protein
MPHFPPLESFPRFCWKKFRLKNFLWEKSLWEEFLWEKSLWEKVFVGKIFVGKSLWEKGSPRCGHPAPPNLIAAFPHKILTLPFQNFPSLRSPSAQINKRHGRMSWGGHKPFNNRPSMPYLFMPYGQ